MGKDIQLILVYRVFDTPKGTFEFRVFRGTDLYWHVDIHHNHNNIASYNVEIPGCCFEYITKCDEFCQYQLSEEQEIKRLQQIKWHITVEGGNKYNLLLTDINNMTQQFKAVLIDENDNIIRQRFFNLSYYYDAEYLFNSLV